MSYAEAKDGLKKKRARGSLAKAVSGGSYSRRSKGSGTEGSAGREKGLYSEKVVRRAAYRKECAA